MCAIALAVLCIVPLVIGAIGCVLAFGALSLWTSALEKARPVHVRNNVVKFPKGD